MLLACFNCGLAEGDRYYTQEVEIPCGKSFNEVPCRYCGCKRLMKLTRYPSNPYRR